MKKGFTLIEVIAVIVLLGVIAAITVPVVNSTINNTKQKSYDAQISLIVEGAQKWGVKNVELLPEGDEVIYVSIRDLISGGFINNANNGQVMNPLTDEPLVGCVEIKYVESYNQYTYNFSENCN